MNISSLQNLLLASALALATLSHGVIIDFDTDADFDGNFVEFRNQSALSRDAAGYLVATGSNQSPTIIYNAAATGGSGGSGGTTLNNPRDTFGSTDGFLVQADVYFERVENGTSFGILTKNPTSGSTDSAYAVLFRNFGSDPEVRFTDFTASLSGGGVGTIQSTQFTNPDTSLNLISTDTWYTVKLLVEDVGSNVRFTASWWNVGGITQIGSNVVWVDESSAIVGPGQVGFRIAANGTNDIRVDNVSIVAIPEPGTLALVGIALGSLVFLRRRRD